MTFLYYEIGRLESILESPPYAAPTYMANDDPKRHAICTGEHSPKIIGGLGLCCGAKCAMASDKATKAITISWAYGFVDIACDDAVRRRCGPLQAYSW